MQFLVAESETPDEREARRESAGKSSGETYAATLEQMRPGCTITIVAPADEQWDDVAIVGYPGLAAFRTLVESEAYKKEADPHRSAALADWRLIATSKADLPG